jgi:diguanylate cyclase (GGDEF)-like protein/PAS domain S-box-containing protein
MEKLPIPDSEGNPQYPLGNSEDIAERKRTEEALRESEYRLDLALEASGLAVWDYDFVSGDVRFSQHWWRILGYALDEVPLRIEAWEKLTHPDDLAHLRSQLAMHLKGSVPVLEAEYRMRAKHGEWRWIRTVGRVVERDATGRALRGIGTHGDVTPRKQQEERVARLSRIQALLSRVNSVIVRIRDRGKLLEEACQIAVRQGGFRMVWIGFVDPHTLEVKPAASAGHEAGYLKLIKFSANPDIPAGQGIIGRAIRAKRALVRGDFAQESDAVNSHEALSRGYRSAIALPLVVEGEATGAMCIYADKAGVFDDEEIKLMNELASDISFALEFITNEEKLDYLAYYDAVTGTANRNLLIDRLAQTLAQAHRYGHLVAVAVLNLDHFKLIDDSLGRNVSNELLKIVAARLGSSVRKTDTLARLGGGEFALILPGQTDPTTVSRVVTRITDTVSADAQVVDLLESILHSISAPMAVGDLELNLTCSIGVSLYPHDGDGGETLLRNAAAALARAKQLGRRNFQFYTAELNVRVAERLSLHSSLRRALEREEFMLYYQPKMSLRTGEISGAEALLRWNKPGSGMVLPGEFIPVLEETGLIIDVGRWAMGRALEEYGHLLAINPWPPRIAVNVSQLQLAQKDFLAVVEKILKNSASGSAGLDLEMTESFIMQDLEVNIPKLRAIREMGVNIAIDDFGTGYSSLSYLAKLPIDALKIDRAFIVNLDVSPDALAIVTAIISLARSLRLKVIAEGVETEAQMKVLQLVNCDEIQGDLISRPLPAGEFREWWERFRARGPQTRCAEA